MESTAVHKLLSLKIDCLGSYPSAGGKYEATTANAATGGNEIGSRLPQDGKCHPTVKLENCT